MIKRFCDYCESELTEENESGPNNPNGSLSTEIKKEQDTLSIEVTTGLNGSLKKGDVCKHCILDALYKLDDRPMPGPHV